MATVTHAQLLGTGIKLNDVSSRSMSPTRIYFGGLATMDTSVMPAIDLISGKSVPVLPLQTTR